MSPEIVEAALRAYHKANPFLSAMDHPDGIKAALSTAESLIRQQARAEAFEKAAMAFEPDEDGHDSHSYRWTTEEIAAAIRALKEQIPPPRTP
jgi:hypothetical protein